MRSGRVVGEGAKRGPLEWCGADIGAMGAAWTCTGRGILAVLEDALAPGLGPGVARKVGPTASGVAILMPDGR